MPREARPRRAGNCTVLRVLSRQYHTFETKSLTLQLRWKRDSAAWPDDAQLHEGRVQCAHTEVPVRRVWGCYRVSLGARTVIRPSSFRTHIQLCHCAPHPTAEGCRGPWFPRGCLARRVKSLAPSMRCRTEEMSVCTRVRARKRCGSLSRMPYLSACRVVMCTTSVSLRGQQHCVAPPSLRRVGDAVASDWACAPVGWPVDATPTWTGAREAWPTSSAAAYG